MFSLTERSNNDMSICRCKIGMILLTLEKEYILKDNGSRTLDPNSTISAIVKTVNPISFEAMAISENITELRFCVAAERSIQDIQDDIRSLGNSVGTQQFDLSNIAVDQLP